MRHRFALFAVLLVSFPALASLTPRDAAAEYARLQKWQFSQPIPLTAPVTLSSDTATWTLQSGTVRLMEPDSSGTVTGIVFEGSGRFTMTIPDRFELAQLRRFTNKPDLESIDQAFTQLVVRTSDPAIAKSFPDASAGAYASNAIAEKRHEFWLKELFRDVDALVVAAMLNPGTKELIVDTKTADYDWLIYEYDSWRPEEINVLEFRSAMVESWISLDRPEDRLPDGRPGAARDLATLEHVDVRADLMKRGSFGQVGQHGQRTVDGEYTVAATYGGLAESISALRLDLFPDTRELKVTDESGNALTFFRDHIGKRSAMLDNRLHDDDFVVVLPEPLKRGQTRTIRFDYIRESANYAPGGAWYPMVSETMLQPHTARLELTVHKKNELRAMGRMESRRDEAKSETSVWIVDRPTKMITFSTATRFEEVRLEVDSIPPVVAFGPDFQFSNTAKVRNVGADVANSMQFFQILLADKIEAPQFYVTSIAGNHGQAFDGYLHMGEFTFTSEHPGASELFRAHEVAHEWFGHKVGWASYRDQWLSEALAEYAAMMFVESQVKGGDKFFDEILRSYDGIVKGNLSGGFSKFNRPWLAMMNMNAAHRDRVGPIGHGYRANTAEIPGYLIQSYYKGPLVVHMLRMMLRYRTNSDDLFVKTLRDYVHDYSGKRATTADFRRVLERNAPGDWSWFFDSWIYGADLPSYRWRYDVAPTADGKFEVTLKVQRKDVAKGFVAVIPVRIDLGDNKHGYVFMFNKEDEQTLSTIVPLKPKNVVFAPEHSLLALIKRD